MEYRLAVLASGEGSNLAALRGAGVRAALVIADRACGALGVARAQDIPALLIPRGSRRTRDLFDEEVVAALGAFGITHIACLGFMTILGRRMFGAYGGRIYNGHPSLLPAFKGAHAVEDAYAAGVSMTGCTLHEMELAIDSGRIIAQARVPIEPGDAVETLRARIKAREHELYPWALGHVLAES